MDDRYAEGQGMPVPGAEHEREEEAGGYCIKLYVGPDNKVRSVTVSEKPESGEEGQEQGQDAGSLAEAFEMVETIIEQRAGGQSMQDERGDMDAAMSGYAGPSGQHRGMGIKRVFSES